MALKKVQVSISGQEGNVPRPARRPGGSELCPAGTPSLITTHWVPVSKSGLHITRAISCLFLLYEKGSPNCYEMCETVRPCGCASAIQTQLNHGNMEGKKAGACWWSRTRIFENWDVRSTDFLNLVGNIRQYSEQHFV